MAELLSPTVPDRPVVPDAADRATIGTALTSTLFVEAGAGTGKTTALVGRIVELVATGTATLGHVAAITFTEAAAAELRDRVREALERAAGAETDPTRAARCAAATSELDQAALTTLHGFAQRLLVDHALEAGLPPRVRVRDELRSTMAFDERWRGTVDALVEDPPVRRAVARAWCAGVTFTHLRAIARRLDENWDLVADWQPEPTTLGTVDPTALLELLDEAAAAVAGRDEGDRLVQLLTALVAARDDLARAQRAQRTAPDDVAAEVELLELLIELPVPEGDKRVGNRGNKATWDGDVATPRGLAECIVDEVRRLRSQALHDALDVVLVALRDATLADAEARRRAGDLEFHDLLVLARRLVREHPDARAALRRQYTHLLIDEFQDTDPIQAELALRLAAAVEHADAPTGVDEELALDAGRLFFVGDAQQAIYRFRRADIGLFADVRERVTDTPVELRANFRSVPGILAWVNAAFAALFGDGEPGVQPPHRPLEASRAPVHTDPVVHRIGGPAAPRARVGAIRAEQADDVARTILLAHTEGWLVHDPDSGPRPVRLGDICVLVPTRTGLPALERAFERRGLTYRIDASSLVFATQEVRDLLNVLRAVDDPTDEVAVVAALRAPVLGCGDDDLLRWHAAGRRFDRSPAGADGPVAEGLARLAAWRAQARWSSVSALVELVVREGRLMEAALTRRRPRDVWRRLRYVADQARAFADDGGATLREFLRWMDLQADEDSRVVEAVLPESDDDAVRVMTIHASKGLEFPMVVLTGLERQRRPEPGVQVRWHDGRPELKIRAELASRGFGALDERERSLELAEQRRLLYVATTRARDHLVVAMHHPVRTSGESVDCHAGDLERLRDLPWAELDLDGAPDRFTPRAEAPSAPRRSDDLADPTATPDAWRDWCTAHELALARAARPAAQSPSRLAETAGEPGPGRGTDDGARTDADRPPWQRGRGGTAVGRAVHATLQLVDLADHGDLEAIAAAQATAEGVGGRVDEVVHMARRALDHDLLRQAATGTCRRELYLGAPVGGTVLEGFVDLLVETDRGLVVVDYKTDAVADDAAIAQKVDRYRLQAAAYAELVEATLGRPVVECMLLFVGTDPATARPIPDLAGARAELRARLGGEP